MAEGFIQPKNGRYYVGLNVATASGVRKQQWFGGYRTKKEANARRIEVVHQHNNGELLNAEKLTLNQYVNDHWLPLIESTVKPTTFQSYRSQLTTHVLPHLGGTQLTKLTPTQLDALYRQLLKTGRKNGDRNGLSATTVRYIHRVLHRLLSDAVRKGLLSRNPAVAADQPRRAAKTEMKFWTPEQLRQFLQGSLNSPQAALWRLAAYTGMRRGELLALRWSDIDLDAARLTINNAITNHGTQIFESTPKTKRSRRSIDLDNGTITILRKHATTQKQQKLLAGSAYNDSGLVFANPIGNYPDPDAISAKFKKESAAAGVPPIRFHDLRHTHVAVLSAAGVPPRAISDRLGHSSVAFTLDQYGHVSPADSKDVAVRFADAVGA